MSKIILVGGNHAGTACANTILDNYKDEELIIIDGNSNISFLGCGMALWIGGQIDGSEGLFYSSKDILEKKGAKVLMETAVNKIDWDNKVVYAKDKDGNEVKESYDKLVLATGSLPIIPNIPGKDLDNVQQVKIFQDAQKAIERLEDESIKDVIVIGAGYIGVELAEAFQLRGKKTRMIDLADSVLCTYYDKEFTDEMQKNLEAHGIEVNLGQTVVELKGENGKVTDVITDKGSYKADMVVMCIGFRPNTELGKDHLELFKNGAYLTNDRQKTSDDNVYAIGDCTTIFDNAANAEGYIALASNAVRSGIVGAHNVCGTELHSIGVQGSNGIKIFDLCMASTGMNLLKAESLGVDVLYSDYEDFQKPEFMKDDNEKVKLRIVYEKASRRIVGAQIMSKYDISMMVHMFSLAIQKHVTIEELALTDIFFLPHYNKPYNYVTMAALTAK